MIRKKYPIKETIAQYLKYDPELGRLIWIQNMSATGRKGTIAGCINNITGYRYINLDKHRYMEHRLIYIYHYGDIPEGLEIDHLDNERANNKIENLKPVTPSENQRKHFKYKNNTSGYTGVVFDKSKNKWIARLQLNYKQIFLGYFDSEIEAGKVRQAANEKYGFAKLHGTEKSA